jgi:type IV fimbrial biogenesis protein FimT
VRAIKRPAAGFTLIEAVVALAIMGVLMAVGIPSLSTWNQGRKAAAAAGFYKEGFQLARNQAVTHNSASRLVLSDNTVSGQLDWQVDICFPTPSTPCNEDSGSWSTVSAAAEADPDQAHGFRSVVRSADALPATRNLMLSVSPSGADAIYFTPQGWVDAGISPRVQRIDLMPAVGRTGAFRPQAVVVTLAGTASVCDPGVATHDSRGCPPQSPQ